MAATGVARRYAVALCEIAEERGLLERVEQELGSVVAALQQDPKLRQLLLHQSIEPAAKKQLLAEALGGAVHELTRNFLDLLVEKRRENLLPDIYRAYVRCANEARGVLEVEVRSAVPLTAEQVDEVVQAVQASTGKTIKASAAVDPSLLGGLVVRIGDLVIDGSIATRLRNLKQRLRQARIQTVG